jgi:hypothetical protein
MAAGKPGFWIPVSFIKFRFLFNSSWVPRRKAGMKLEQRLKTGGVKRLGSLLVVGLSLLLVISCGGGGGGGGGSGAGSGLEVNTNSVSFTANYYGALPKSVNHQHIRFAGDPSNDGEGSMHAQR